ncbi:hypothetical protein [Streptomyces sp. or20]|uniref:hypothetical protein n=1 Tax=Streptomyces sp. or20 TaxID=1828016 RepID=UPI000BEFC965|nr:hypothetical protein [Streptomyces sp. or20]
MTENLNKPPFDDQLIHRVRAAARQSKADDKELERHGAALAAACVGMVLAIPLQAFVLMLVMGAVHGAFIAVPAIGYGTSVLFVLGANLLAGFTRRLFRK